MNKVTKMKKRRIKQGVKIRKRREKYEGDDGLAMIAAGLDDSQWRIWDCLPPHIKQLWRLRAKTAMSTLELE